MNEYSHTKEEKNQEITLSKKAYHAPRLTLFGDIRDLTLAPSPGFAESGRGANHRARFRQP